MTAVGLVTAFIQCQQFSSTCLFALRVDCPQCLSEQRGQVAFGDVLGAVYGDKWGVGPAAGRQQRGSDHQPCRAVIALPAAVVKLRMLKIGEVWLRSLP